eukprot:TRINITY_DN7350_c0_g1_i4.p1 TRINITY_DN7350_c0_g1~~TRINITY_DN7350_c0_g1_i4.p1  ORF type:complete len:435 (+),score=142.50 TRINITY_DN7350_c0_g1_i4:103-1305(+)
MAILGLDTATKKTIFIFYMALWCALRLLIYGSKRQGSSAPEYNQTSLLVFVCVTKLMMALGMYMQDDGSFAKLADQVRGSKKLFFRYFLPALSYVVYDNLTFANLTYSDPVTYVILMQMRLACTGLMWQAFFSRPLNRNQWMAILVLTLACLVQKGLAIKTARGSVEERASLIISLALIAFQIACGVFSSVFNEVLLKEKGTVGTNLQNMYMYTWSIVCNLVWLALCPSKTWCAGDLREAMSLQELGKLLSPLVLAIGCILAFIGIVTSLFIKYLDSVRKTIASAMEIFVDAVLAWLIFGVPLGLNTVMACILASGGVLLYSRPVSPAAAPKHPAAADGRCSPVRARPGGSGSPTGGRGRGGSAGRHSPPDPADVLSADEEHARARRPESEASDISRAEQ